MSDGSPIRTRRIESYVPAFVRPLSLLPAVLALLLTLVVSPARAATVSFAGHAYDFVAADNITWTDANTAAGTMTYSGVTGHLVTIFSQAENDFVLGLLTGLVGSYWLGGSDAVTEGAWKWVTGEQFWQGGANGTVGPDVSYANWLSPIEPSNTNGNENYLAMFGGAVSTGTFTQPGKWNDLMNSEPSGSDYYSINGYVVEYDLPTPVPVPAAFWLFGSGLLSLLAIIRRNKR